MKILFSVGLFFLLWINSVLSADGALVNFSAADVQPAYTFNYSQQYGGNGGFVLGYIFSVDQPITVTQLGFYNDNARTGTNGGLLFDSHSVGLYAVNPDNTGTLLTSAVVLPSDPLVGQFTFQNIAPLTLAPGTYELMAVVGFNDNYTHDPASLAFHPSVIFGFNVEASGTGGVLQFSPYGETSGITYGWFGPNMMIVPVPEPGLMLTLMGMGAVLLRGSIKKRVV